MRTTLAAAALAILGGCIGGPEGSSVVKTDDEVRQQRIAQETFEGWNRATQTGDAEANYRGLSAGLRSQWLWDRMRDRTDAVTPGYLARLDGSLRMIVDRWFEMHEKNTPGRASRLPDTILASRWLFEVYREHFIRARDQVVNEAKHRTVTEVYVDRDGVTVMTDVQGVAELIGMTYEGDGWKVDSWRHAR